MRNANGCLFVIAKVTSYLQPCLVWAVAPERLRDEEPGVEHLGVDGEERAAVVKEHGQLPQAVDGEVHRALRKATVSKNKAPMGFATFWEMKTFVDILPTSTDQGYKAGSGAALCCRRKKCIFFYFLTL